MKLTMLTLAVAALAAFALVRPALAQDELPTSPAFERALVVEEVEHDLRQALELYAAVAADEGAPEALRRRAWLRIGRARAALGQMDEARAALERAAAGEDAVAALARERLADPGRDEERARLLREEAQRWIDALPSEGGNQFANVSGIPAGQNLLWIGRAAVPVIVRELERRRSSEEPYAEPGYKDSLLFAALWRIGGPEAEAYLDRVRGLEEVELRRVAARSLVGDHVVVGGTGEIAERYLRDPAPSGAVALAALRASEATIGQYAAAEVIALVDSPVKEVRLQAMSTLQRHWKLLVDDPRPALALLLPKLERALADVSPQIGQAALELLRVVGSYTGESRALLLRALVGSDPQRSFLSGPILSISADDAGARALAEVLPALAPADTENLAPRDVSVRRCIEEYLQVFDAAQLDTVLTALRAGFSIHEIGGWLQRHCGAAQSERILAAALEVPDPSAVYLLNGWLTDTRFAESDWAPLRRLEQELARWEPEVDWSKPFSRCFAAVYAAMGATGAPEAIARLGELVEQPSGPERYRALVEALVAALAVAPERAFEPARALLLTATAGADPRGEVRTDRNRLFAHLVHAGDPQAFALLPRAFALGMNENGGYYAPEWVDQPRFRGGSRLGVGWLAWHEQVDGELVWFHGYSPEEAAALWDELLALPRGDSWNGAWERLRQVLTARWTTSPPRGTVHVPSNFVAPPPRIVEVAARRWAERAELEREPLDANKMYGLVALLEIGRRHVVQDEAALAAVRALHSACLSSPSAELRRIAVDLLPDELDEAQRAALLAALSDPERAVAERAFARVFDARTPVPPEVFARALENPDAGLRATAIRQAAALVEGGAVARVEPALADPAPQVRAAACAYLGTQVEAEVVPELLARLTDLDADVRAAAAEALRAIRFYHDQKAHWDRIYAGIDLSAAGAAEALLRQAAPDQPRERRLLAIRSLGALGAPETLPILIEWTALDDAELAAEARAAIARIHAR